MNAAPPPDPRSALDPLVKRIRAFVRDLEAASSGEDEETDEETEEARRTGASEGRGRQG